MKTKSMSRGRTNQLVASIVFILVLIAVIGGYAANVFFNARSGADWVLIVPVAIFSILALLFAIREDVKIFSTRQDEEGGASEKGAGPALLFMGALVSYVALIPYIGIEIATVAFLGIALVIQGERRPTVLAGISIIGGGALVWCFVRLFSVSMPTLIL